MNYLTQIDIILIIITISLVIHNLALIVLVGFCAKYEKWIDSIQVLEKLINENKKYTQTQTEEFIQEPTALPYDETEEQQPKDVRKSNLAYPVTL